MAEPGPALPNRVAVRCSSLYLQVRLLCEAAGHEVVSLKRVRIGGYRLSRFIKVGEYR